MEEGEYGVHITKTRVELSIAQAGGSGEAEDVETVVVGDQDDVVVVVDDICAVVDTSSSLAPFESASVSPNLWNSPSVRRQGAIWRISAYHYHSVTAGIPPLTRRPHIDFQLVTVSESGFLKGLLYYLHSPHSRLLDPSAESAPELPRSGYTHSQTLPPQTELTSSSSAAAPIAGLQPAVRRMEFRGTLALLLTPRISLIP